MKERRKYQRYPASLQATVRQGGDGTPCDCLISELSREGARLLSREKIQFGQTVDLTVTVPGATEPVAARMTVRWTRQVYDHADYQYLAGGELHGADAEGVQRLLDHARSAPRPS